MCSFFTDRHHKPRPTQQFLFSCNFTSANAYVTKPPEKARASAQNPKTDGQVPVRKIPLAIAAPRPLPPAARAMKAWCSASRSVQPLSNRLRPTPPCLILEKSPSHNHPIRPERAPDSSNQRMATARLKQDRSSLGQPTLPPRPPHPSTPHRLLT